MHEHKNSVISVVITSALDTDQSIPRLLGNCYAHQQVPVSGLKSLQSLCCCGSWPKATVLVLVGPGPMALDSPKHWPWLWHSTHNSLATETTKKNHALTSKTTRFASGFSRNSNHCPAPIKTSTYVSWYSKTIGSGSGFSRTSTYGSVTPKDYEPGS